MRVLLIALFLGYGAACTTLSRVNGAKTLEPGQAQVGLSGTLQRGGNPLSVGTIPLPQGELFGRYGVSENLDVGARIYLVGAGIDARYRFWHNERWHFAVNPAFNAVYIPFSNTARGNGSFDVRAPVIAEVFLGKRQIHALSVAPTLILRQQYTTMDLVEAGDGRLWRLDAFAGGGARYEFQPWARKEERKSPFVFGVTADVFGQPARHAGIAYTAGFDLSLRSVPRK